MFFFEIGCQKLGHPVPESNLVAESNNAVSQQMHRYRPSACEFQYAPLNARSVPAFRVMMKASCGKSRCHSASSLTILGTSATPKLRPEEEKSSIETSAVGNGGEAPFARFAISSAISKHAPERRTVRRVEASRRACVSMMLMLVM